METRGIGREGREGMESDRREVKEGEGKERRGGGSTT